MTTYIIIAVQDYKKYGFSNTVHTDKGVVLIKENGVYTEYSDKIAPFFKDVLGKDFGNEPLVLPPFSYETILNLCEAALKSILKTQKRTPDAWDATNSISKYDDMYQFFEEDYVINLRKDADEFLCSFYDFYLNLKRFSDYGYPLYITPATIEDTQNHWGNFKVGDTYNPISPQEKN